MLRLRLLLLSPIAIAFLPQTASAQDAAPGLANSGDSAWLLSAALLVLLAALPGLALFQAGRSRPGSSVALLVQIPCVIASVSLAWIVVGYTLAFGDVGSGWIGGGNALMLLGTAGVHSGLSIPESTFALFQIVCAVFASALLPGAWAGRAKLGWIVLFVALWSLVVLAPVTHWLWGGGWLAMRIGTVDYAGGLVLQLSAGVSALVAAAIMGRGNDFGRVQRGAGLAPISLAGALLLWIGGLALCGGSALSADEDAASAILCAHAAACGGALARLILQRLRRDALHPETIACGLVAGLAAIAPAAGYVSPAAGALIGALGSIAAAFVPSLVRRLRIDDRLDVFALFAVPAATGSLLLAPLMSETAGGPGYEEGVTLLSQLSAQAIGIAVVIAWSALGTAVIALMTSVAVPMRVPEQAEMAGLDKSFDADG